MFQRCLVFICLGLAVLSINGCTSGQTENPDWPKRFKASGVVTYQGKAIEGADVVFQSNDGKATATAKTDGSGKFALTTYVQGDGAVSGQHVVTIRRADVVDVTPKDVDVSAGGTALPPKITWIIPEKYSLSNKSGLTASVAETGPNDFNFDLK